MVVILVELVIAVVTGLTFSVFYGVRSRWRETSVGRHLMLMSLVITLEAASFLALGLGVRLPTFFFAIIFGLSDLALIQRLLLLWRAQHQSDR